MTSKSDFLKPKPNSLNWKRFVLNLLTLWTSHGTSYSFIFATVSMICSPGKFSRCIACFKLYISLKSFDLLSELQILKERSTNIHTCTFLSLPFRWISFPFIIFLGSTLTWWRRSWSYDRLDRPDGTLARLDWSSFQLGSHKKTILVRAN